MMEGLSEAKRSPDCVCFCEASESEAGKLTIIDTCDEERFKYVHVLVRRYITLCLNRERQRDAAWQKGGHRRPWESLNLRASP